jgi:Histidine kinase-, DNA gyrase B-, and HSP90-like ATPase
MRREATVVPSAARLMTSLRDIGYDAASAVADLVDNSIDAGATTVEVNVCRKGEWSFISVADNGRGMTERVLDEAMRYGSRRVYSGRDLGKFGLGLKTASLSQCRRLTVATKTTQKGRIRVRRWDLDDVTRRDSWELACPLPSECPRYLVDPLQQTCGTVVLWEKLDRILSYARPDGGHAVRALEAIGDEIAEHLSMVFHRFLSGETRNRRKLTILFNGTALEAWDPFARREPATRCLSEQQLFVDDAGTPHVVTVRPYVLPSQVQFTTIEEHGRAAGPKKWNRQQGFYIYRGDRLIQSGGWNRLRTMDEHSKLARIAVDVPSGLDDLFQINVAKMRVVLPDAIRPQLRSLAAGVVNAAQGAYRRRLHLVDAPDGDASGDDSVVPQEHATQDSIGAVWPLIVDVLARELIDHPELLDRVLLALANAQQTTVAEAAAPA